jgi:glc operon protein GlcG
MLIRTAAAALALLAASTQAATPQKPVLTDAVAHTALAAALAHAQAVHAPGAAIAIVDDGGSVVLLERLDSTFPAGPDISIGKARTAVAFRKPTRVFEELINKGRTAMVTVPAVTHFTPLQGGVPLVIDNQVVGGIGVSGAASAAQDDEIAQAGADGLSTTAAAATSRVFPAPRVTEALRAGATLLATGEYSVNMSRRDGPGSAEVHVRDTDIFYVLAGSAELVTGGTVVGGAVSGPDEIRGSAIEGGTSQRLAAGDVVTIPRGVPHWFRSVPAPFTYFVVKSTASGG